MEDNDTGFDLVGALMDYESGEADGDEVLELFSRLVASGTAWNLQGHYGRQATALIDQGWIAKDGTILRRVDDE